MRRFVILLTSAFVFLALDRLVGSGAVAVGLYSAGVLLLGWSANEWGNRLTQRFRRPAAVAAPVALLAAGRLLCVYPPHSGDHFFFTAVKGLSLWNPTVGDLFLNSLLLLWLASFLHRQLQPAGEPSRRRLLPAFGAYALTGLGLWGHGFLTRRLVLRSGLQFDFGDIFQLDSPALLGLAAVLLSLAALFVLSYRLVGLAQRWAPRPGRRLGLLAGGLLLVLLFDWLAPTGLSPVIFLLTAVTFLALNDLFIETRVPGLTQLTVWLFLFSAYSAGVLYKNHLDQDRQQRLTLAQALSRERDATAEAALAELARNIQSLPASQVGGPPPEEAAVQKDIDARLALASPYLFRHYRYDLFSLHPAGSPPLLAGKRTEDARAVLSRLEPTGIPGVGRWTPAGRPYAYVLGLSVANADSSRLLLAFRRWTQEVAPGYRRLIEAPPYRGLAALEAYSYAVYREGHLLESRGGNHPVALRSDALPPPGEWREAFSSRRAETWYQAPEGGVVLVTRELGGPLKPVNLFSFIFLLFSLLAVLLAILNRYTEAVPADGGFPAAGPPSLRNRIQLAVIGLVIGAFLLIGLVTASFFRSSTLEQEREDLLQTAGLIRSDLDRGLPGDTSDTGAILLRTARRYRQGLDLYDGEGELMATTSAFVYDAGLRSPRMPEAALAALRVQPAGIITVPESLGGSSYPQVYLALQTRPAAYLGLPSPAWDARPAERGDRLLATLLNVYVFLLLTAGVVAIAVSNSITRPLTRLEEKLRSTRLGRNEPLEWTGQDEVAELIAAYNRMISELEESTEKLRQTEREGAWREMAQQVAHEIKNPLTPMKLSLQHLQRASEADPGQARELLRRTGRTLIEQIDGLARIASEFSNFAKMPAPDPEPVDVTDLLRSVADLFRRQSAHPEALRLDLPESPVVVTADRTHLQRILNNLLQNAWQAVPQERSPRIRLGLETGEARVRIYVADNGTGIPEDWRQRVFEPRFTTKSSGMGLGLAMCKGMVEQMNGRIWLEPAEGEGTVFYLELARDQPPAAGSEP